MFKWALPVALLAAPAYAVPSVIPSPTQVGSANYSYYGFKLYAAKLFTPNGAAYAANQPFILELEYKRTVSQSQFIEATLSEMERIEGSLPQAATLSAKFEACFRNVTTGDKIAAHRVSASSVDLYLNDAKTCRLSHPNIANRFFAIWLSDKSRSPRLTRALRGE